MVEAIESLQHELLERYDSVLVTDVDELVVPDPRTGTLGDYLDRFDEEWVNCLGYELLHMRDFEPPLDLERPILNQRGHWFYNDAYDKAALATVPMSWRPGFHGRSDFHYNLDPDLRLIHLHRHGLRPVPRAPPCPTPQAMGRSPTRRKRWALHNRIVEEEEFRRWFYEDSCFANLEIKPERIPAAWRGAF